jgi:DNA (cytosine-5)-methyltransferase 1
MSAVLILFAGGADGWGLGLKRCGHQIVACAEIDPLRRAALRHHHPGAVIYDDVRDVTRDRLIYDLGYLPGIVVGSPPCTDISCAANGRAAGIDGARSGLYFEFVRIVGEVRPDWYAAENAAQLKTRGYDRVQAALESVGYACWPQVVGAREAGYFHLRKRSWLCGFALDRLYALDADAYCAEPATGLAPARGQIGAKGVGAAYADADRGEPRGRLRQRQSDAFGPYAQAASDAGRHLELQPRRAFGQERRWAGHGDLQADADTLGVGRAGIDGPSPWRRQAQARARLPDYLAAVERAARAVGLGGRSRLAEHYRVANGLPAGLARQCISAYGDAIVPDIAEAIGLTMDQLVSELVG